MSLTGSSVVEVLVEGVVELDVDVFFGAGFFVAFGRSKPFFTS